LAHVRPLSDAAGVAPATSWDVGRSERTLLVFNTSQSTTTVAASEYQFLKFDQKADHREFRLATAHWSSVSTGDEKNNLPVTFDKIAPRTYKAVLNLLKPGEYGLLPPTANTNIGLGSVGKVYTFGIKE